MSTNRARKGVSSPRKAGARRGPAAGDESALSYRGILRRMAWIVAAFGCTFVIASLLSFSPSDPPSHAAAPLNESPVNWCGPVGAFLAFKLYHMFDLGAWLLVASVAGWLIARATGRAVDQLALRIIGVGLMSAAVASFIALLFADTGPMPEGAGGLLGIAIVDELTTRFSTLGSLLILAMVFGVGATLAVDSLIVMAGEAAVGVWRRLAEVNWPRVPFSLEGVRGLRLPRWERAAATAATTDQIERSADVTVASPSMAPSRTRIRLRRPEEEVEEDLDEDAADAAAEADEAAVMEAEEEGDSDADQEPTIATPQAGEAAAAPRAPMDAAALREKIKNLPISIANKAPAASPVVAKPQDLSGYKFPPIEILEDPESNFSEAMAEHVREQAEILERALQTYRIDAEVVAIDAGPVITLYEVQLAPGTKVAAINNIASDVARELKAQNIRVVPNTAGKSTVGIEVPNLKKEKVRLKELMALGGQQVFDKMALPMFLGKDASGNPLISDLAAMPHMLIAGTTGSGKSVCINTIIVSFLYARRPDELKLILVDPKMVEMAQFRDIPHLMCPVVTEMSKAAAILEWCVTQMEERYSLLAEAGVRNLDAYNKLSWEDLKDRFNPEGAEEEAKIPRKLPRIVFVIDELADLIMTHKEVESFIVRIAQKARAVGIHLILATQRPQANVVTGLIKSNMPCRIAFKVASGMDSRIVLDSKGAELLLGHGDMLYLSPNTHKLMRAQGTLVDDMEIRQVVRFLKQVASPSFEPQLVQLRAPGVSEEDGERDELFDAAVDVLVETRRGSVSLLQRRLSIGYARASRLVEQMAQAGILGEYKGSQAREVTITKEEWEMMKQQMATAGAEFADAAPDGGVREIVGGQSVQSPYYGTLGARTAPPAEDEADIDEDIAGTDLDVDPIDPDDELVSIDDAMGDASFDDEVTDEERELARLAGDEDGGDGAYEYGDEDEPA